MDSSQTLHDFVLNLLTDPDARSAFELDPEGTLRGAGLGDLTPADVQDVVPLVVDYAPVQGITSLDAVNGLGFGAVDTDPLGVVGQLQSVAQQVGVAAAPTGVDVNAAALGAITVDPVGLGFGASTLSGVSVGASPNGVAVDTSGAYDVAGTLDAEVLGPVGGDPVGTVTSTVDGAVGTTGGLLDGTTPDGLLGTADVAVSTVTGVLGGATGLVDSLDVGGAGSGGLGLDGLGGGLTGVPGTVGDLDPTGAVAGVTGGVDSTLDGVGVGRITGDLGLTGDAGASVGGGALGLTDGLL